MSTYSRTNPLIARIKERALLNGAGASKETFHIERSLGGAHLPFQVGDSIGIFPDNNPKLVQSILHALHLTGDEELLDSRSNRHYSAREFLTRKANLAKCTSSFVKMLHDHGAKNLDELLIAENKPQLTEARHTHDLGDLLRVFPGARIGAQELATLLPLMPRFYSIASSVHMFPDEIHLTVASLTYTAHGETRYGVGSHFLCQYATPDTPIPLYVQPSNGFTIPSDPDAPIILIGPGTGIAPFRAFLQERIALQHPGRNWLFFGERNSKTDFYYAPFFRELQRLGRLRLDTAFSRDQAEKIYVQHRLWEQRADLFEWIQNGAYVYICGDAEKMAKDVEQTFLRIARDQGSLDEEGAKLWLKALRQNRHYLTDVY